MTVTETTIGNILTRTSGYLRTVASHSLQPYRGCSYGNSLCGVGCYVQHSRHLLGGRAWGSFLEVRTNAAESYLGNVDRERRWAHNRGEQFVIFCASATDPFVPQEQRYGVTASVLEAMCESPPDRLMLQTHSHLVANAAERLVSLSQKCDVRVHVSIETDREHIVGLPPHASPVARRFEACRLLKARGLFTVVTVSPLLPISDPSAFFARIAECADAVVLDHFIGGDGTEDGRRTLSTPLPAAMEAIEPESVALAYRQQMADVAERYLPGRVGIGAAGFAGRYAEIACADLGITSARRENSPL
jgi:DNA repair photolyase